MQCGQQKGPGILKVESNRIRVQGKDLGQSEAWPSLYGVPCPVGIGQLMLFSLKNDFFRKHKCPSFNLPDLCYLIDAKLRI
jgi:hypothetical protein